MWTVIFSASGLAVTGFFFLIVRVDKACEGFDGKVKAVDTELKNRITYKEINEGFHRKEFIDIYLKMIESQLASLSKSMMNISEKLDAVLIKKYNRAPDKE